MSIAIVLDFETTGLTLPSVANVNDQPRAIEIGAARVDNGVVVETLSQLVNPGIQIEPVITKITGLTNDDLKGQPSFKDAEPKLRHIFRGADAMIAHNAPFDAAILRYDLQRAGIEDFPWPAQIICSVEEFHFMYGRKMKLTELYERACGKPLAQTHRALDDVMALVETLAALKFWEAFA